MFAAASARRLSVIPTHREYLGAQRGQVVLHGLGLEERTLEPKQLDPQALKVMREEHCYQRGKMGGGIN